jgi:hypothetical protein
MTNRTKSPDNNHVASILPNTGSGVGLGMLVGTVVGTAVVDSD